MSSDIYINKMPILAYQELIKELNKHGSWTSPGGAEEMLMDWAKRNKTIGQLYDYLQNMGQESDCLRDLLPENHPKSRKLSYETLKNFCENFDQKQKIGKGHFGEYYKGQNKKSHDIAVKVMLKVPQNSRDVKVVKEFVTEMHKVRHDNFLPLLYSCLTSTEFCLVYPFMDNGALFDWLNQHTGPQILSWPQRFVIACEMAEGLYYLKKHHIVHGNIKSKNVLLDDLFKPRIGDFSLARTIEHISTPSIFHTVTEKIALSSYLPRDFLKKPHLYWNSQLDTFSYGIVLFELVTGKGPNWMDPDSGHSFRKIIRDFKIDIHLLEAFMDKNVDSGNEWIAHVLFLMAGSCTMEKADERRKIEKIFFNFQEFFTQDQFNEISGDADSIQQDTNGHDSNNQEFDGQISNNSGPNIPAILLQDSISESNSDLVRSFTQSFSKTVTESFAESSNISVTSRSSFSSLLKYIGSLPNLESQDDE